MSQQVQLLVVEDDALIRLAVEDALRGGGYAVLCASDGDTALEMLSQRSGQIGGLITDIRLGAGPNGWDIAHRAREMNSGICVVYATGDSAADWPAFGVPKSMVLQKPFADAQLLAAISNLLNEASAIASMAAEIPDQGD